MSLSNLQDTACQDKLSVLDSRIGNGTPRTNSCIFNKLPVDNRHTKWNFNRTDCKAGLTNDMTFDTKRFLKERFKTPNELILLLRSYGIEPPREATAAQWFNRASVPSDWFPILVSALELHTGSPVSLVSYFGE